MGCLGSHGRGKHQPNCGPFRPPARRRLPPQPARGALRYPWPRAHRGRAKVAGCLAVWAMLPAPHEQPDPAVRQACVGFGVMTSARGVVAASRRCASTRHTASRPVKIPTSVPELSVTRTDPAWPSRIRSQASATVAAWFRVIGQCSKVTWPSFRMESSAKAAKRPDRQRMGFDPGGCSVPIGGRAV